MKYLSKHGGKDPNWISKNENYNIWDTKYTKYDHNRLETAEKKDE